MWLFSFVDNLCKQIGPRSGPTNVRPDLDPNYLTLWWYYWWYFLKKIILKKSSMQKLPLKHNYWSTHLPNRICMFAILRRTPMYWTIFLFKVKHSYTSIIESYRHKVGVFWMNIKAHNSAVSFIDILGEGWVFQWVEWQHTSALLHEIIWKYHRKCVLSQGAF